MKRTEDWRYWSIEGTEDPPPPTLVLSDGPPQFGVGWRLATDEEIEQYESYWSEQDD